MNVLMKSVVLIALGIIALLISLLSFMKMKGKPGFKITFSVFRGIVFFILFYIPFIDQSKILNELPVKIIGIFILCFGLVLAISGSKKLMTTDLTGVKGIPDKLVMDGIYSHIRHPINLGLMMVFTGWYLIFAGKYSLIFLGVLLVFLILETFWEERNLIKTFENEYIDYKKKVGILIPSKKKKRIV